jgi:hypothetical protein
VSDPVTTPQLRAVAHQNACVAAPDIDELVRLETEVWRALAAGDADADERLLSEDFLGVYPTGFSDRAEHAGQLVRGPTIEDFELSDARTLAVSDEAVMLAYRARYRRSSPSSTSSRGSASETMYVSSLWCLRDGAWLNVFSQDTPTA